MNITEIEGNLQKLIETIDKDNFIYDLLLAYGISKTSITRLKKGDFNLSQTPEEVLYKGKVFFKPEKKEKLLFELEELAKEERILKHKPRFIILTDYKTIVAKDLKKKYNRDFKISDLPKYIDFFLPFTGAEIYKSSNDNKADRDAAYKLGQLYEILVSNNPAYRKESHSLNVFLSRLLFCFFAEDTGIFDRESLFTETLSKYTEENGSNVHEFLNSLFQKFNSKHENDFPKYLQSFPYVNGGLFRDNILSPRFSALSRKMLLECGDLDWSEINPDIFGSMIQAIADPEERSNLGMHYTSVSNIKKLIEPLFLAELKEEFQKNIESAVNLKKLIIRIAKIKFFDPACGSGNFLIIAYKEIRLLEIEIILRLLELEKQQSIFYTSINLSQFIGIEIKDFAHEMAILSLWLAEHQMNQVFENRLENHGRSTPILPLKESARIICENAARVNWIHICRNAMSEEIYILGNPPYLGARLQEDYQKEDVAFVLGSVHGSNNLDYISIWFYKAKNFIQGCNAKCAFVSTNSICQGEQVSLLWPQILTNGIEIEFAYKSFKWTNNAKGNAGVTVIIVGLRNKSNMPKFIFYDKIKKETKNINAYLLDSGEIYILPRTKALSKVPEMNFGSMANDKGNLLLDEREKEDLIKEAPSAEFFIKKFCGGIEFLKGINKYCLWISNDQMEDAKKIDKIRIRIDNVKELREKSDRVATQKLALIPYSFGEIRHKNTDSIIVPRTTSERREYIPMGFLTSETIISDSAMAIYNAQPWLFGIIHSKMHMIWVDTVGGKLETRYRYSAKLCYNTFPLPEISIKQKEIINQYVFQILDERANYPEKTISWLYDPETMPKGLHQRHKELDEAIERLYRLNPFQSDIERLEFLFKMYEEMTKQNTLFAKEKRSKLK